MIICIEDFDEINNATICPNPAGAPNPENPDSTYLVIAVKDNVLQAQLKVGKEQCYVAVNRTVGCSF